MKLYFSVFLMSVTAIDWGSSSKSSNTFGKDSNSWGSDSNSWGDSSNSRNSKTSRQRLNQLSLGCGTRTTFLAERRTEDFLRVRPRTVRLKDRSGRRTEQVSSEADAGGRWTRMDQVRPVSPGFIHKFHLESRKRSV